LPDSFAVAVDPIGYAAYQPDSPVQFNQHLFNRSDTSFFPLGSV
jgi:hypothetical protein